MYPEFSKGLKTEIKDLVYRYKALIIGTGRRDSVKLHSALVIIEKAFYKPGVIISRSSTNPIVYKSDDTGKLRTDFANLDLAGVVVLGRIAYRKAAKDDLAVAELKLNDFKVI